MLNNSKVEFQSQDYSITLPKLFSDETVKIDIFFIPKYYKTYPGIKLLFHFVENLISGGGQNKNELKKSIKGVSVSGNISLNDMDEIVLNLDVPKHPYLSLKTYTSKRLQKLF